MVALIELKWTDAVYDYDIVHYNVYIDDSLTTQEEGNRYVAYDLKQATYYKFFVVALATDGEYLKSNVINVRTPYEGQSALSYTLNFDL